MPPTYTRRTPAATAVTGYAALWDAESVPLECLGGKRERFAVAAFSEVLAARPNVLALVGHHFGKVLGSTHGGELWLSQDARGLRFSLRSAEAVELFPRLLGMSLLFKPAKVREVGGVVIVERVRRLDEVSLCVDCPPAYGETRRYLRLTA